jgi:alpha-mannosidase
MHPIRLTPTKISRRIELLASLVYRRRHPLSPFRYYKLESPVSPPPVAVDLDDSAWTTLHPGDYWGPPRTNFALRGEFTVPADWPGDLPAALYLPLGDAGDFSHPETLVYVDGKPYATCDRHHQEILLPPGWRDGRPHKLALHGWTGVANRHGRDARLLIRESQVVAIDVPTRQLHALARVALEAARQLDPNHPAVPHLLNALDDAFKQLDLREPFGDAFYASAQEALRTLRAGVQAAGAPLEVEIIAAGHAHIDVAWLWTLGQTRRKSGRTFTNVMRLMEQFPDYHFTQSQPQLYDYLRQDYPELMDAIKARVEQGRWEPIGGMWVEADCNISGPESLARQFLLGRTFFREQFGPKAESPVLWLPDVFGYAWNLPQLIKQAGLDYFFTIKIGWNKYNRLPYDSFWWQGLDGTRVLTHFSTTPEEWKIDSQATYNAFPRPLTALGSWQNFQQKEFQRTLLMSYGWGDGGGGPNREMLENIREMGDFPGLPKMRYGKVIDFFRRMEEEAGDHLPVWNGELYLEVHRGTYTTQGRNKRANRKSEFLLHDAEALAALASLLDPAYVYPTATFRKAWELVCLNQFHDIIPGSSIGEVYVESLDQYGEVRRMAEMTRDEALKVIASRSNGDLLLVNTTGFARDDLAFWPGHLEAGQRLELADGTPLQTQSTEGGTWIAAQADPFSVTPVMIGDGEDTRLDTHLRATPTLLENDYVRVELNDEGDIIRIYDRANHREVLPPGAIANQWLTFEDRPLDYDAWDIDIFYTDKTYLAEPAESVTVVENGPLRATLLIKRRILNSSYIQRVSLRFNSPQIDFDTTIDWRERHTLLKAAFPVDVLTPTATYEIQWGNVQRPTHHNTSWDWARFETCAQKWVDLSEGNYGVSLLNDCKYGHDIRDNVIRISLLRSPTDPDPEADQGEHRFMYSLLPHAGSWDEQIIAAAYALNDPLIIAAGTRGAARDERLQTSLLTVDAPNVVIETVKRAEDGNGIIVRLYESQRQRRRVTLRTAFKVSAAARVNLLEEPFDDGSPVTAHPEGQAVAFPIRPYEIVTLRLVP